ncbi:phosphoadenosine phosphosulfate reductase family protein [Vibrio tubiashii]|uniref:phosphoadenosine phosphosulfate reductase domain-containing protein n=1 Tax=Vibrio tubiashii TaxID=29498 RepID=UPI001EFD1633|nr:phosphoadenosine phosphosulfate reductase family protein [Vibrio tubiashii]MCG9575436.1 phosphoadenosine phosphosulfate reductase family protein [Vibrio tubiashii]
MGSSSLAIKLHQLTERAIAPHLKGCYQLPTFEGKRVFYIVPLSGGLDSFATAYCLLYLFPDAPFTFLHCDTGVEAFGTTQALDKFEKLTGKKIIKIKGKYDLLEMIEQGGNYLPSQRQRSCTQNLKTLPSKRFFNALKERYEDAMFCQFVGLRADEPLRKGIDWTESHIASAYPLQSLGIVKSEVNLIVEKIQGIPQYYRDKSRSGCTVCPFSRRSEVIAAWRTATETLERASAMEELPEEIKSTYKDMPATVSQLTNVARNWLSFYRPSRLSSPDMPFEVSRGKNKLSSEIDDLFGASLAKRLYVAVEYHYYPNEFGFMSEPMVFFEQAITYSTSMAGIKKALKHFWIHRLHTKEMNNLSEEEIDVERQIQIIEVEVDNFDQLVPPKPDRVYTWQNDQKPLLAIRKTMAICERILLTEGLRQSLKSPVPRERAMATEALKKLSVEPEYGRILSSTPYEKLPLSELVDDIDIVDAPIPCASCAR